MPSTDPQPMHIDAILDISLIAVEQADQVTVMLELEAPAQAPDDERVPATVQAILDRSGSMSGPRLDAARSALAALVDRLDPIDAFGLVVFDNGADVVVPSGPITDKAAIKTAIAAVEPGGSTNLSAGLVRGLQEARRTAGTGGATVLLLSDGKANIGINDPEALAAVAARARANGSTLSTIGVGLGYDETLLSAIAAGGQGNHVFAEEADAAGAAVAAEVDGLLSKTVQAASLVIRPEHAVDTITVYNDLPAAAIEGGVMVELGDLWSGEQRKVLLGFEVPAMSTLGLATVATLELRYVALPELTEQSVTLPISVNIVPGDEAAGRIPRPEVVTERLFQEAQKAKREAADALARGDEELALKRLDAAADSLADLDLDERAAVAALAAEIRAGFVARAAKEARADVHRKSRQRGRGM
jgi:Ca-activated chloride channel family protein